MGRGHQHLEYAVVDGVFYSRVRNICSKGHHQTPNGVSRQRANGIQTSPVVTRVCPELLLHHFQRLVEEAIRGVRKAVLNNNTRTGGTGH